MNESKRGHLHKANILYSVCAPHPAWRGWCSLRRVVPSVTPRDTIRSHRKPTRKHIYTYILMLRHTVTNKKSIRYRALVNPCLVPYIGEINDFVYFRALSTTARRAHTRHVAALVNLQALKILGTLSNGGLVVDTCRTCSHMVQLVIGTWLLLVYRCPRCYMYAHVLGR